MAKAPLFQARHYRFLAALLHELGFKDSDGLVKDFSNALKGDNGNFNPERFEYAVTHGVNSKARQTTKPRRPSSLGRAMKHYLPGSTYGSFAVAGRKGGGFND